MDKLRPPRIAVSNLRKSFGAMPVDSNGASWNRDFVTTTGNVVVDLLHNFHLECGARLHKLRKHCRRPMTSRRRLRCASSVS